MRKTMSIILMTAIIGTTVASTPMSLYANTDSKPNTEKTEADKKKEDAVKKEEERLKTLREKGKEYGKELGEEEGSMIGKKDGLDNKEFNWQKRYKELGNILPPYSSSNEGEYLKGFQEGFKEAFEESYIKGYLEVIKDFYVPEEIKSMAEKMAIKDAVADFYNKLPIDHERHRLTDQEIVDKFLMTGGDTEKYEEVFIVVYRAEYKEKYNKKYRQLRKDELMIDAEGYEQGAKIGENQGILSGKIDFITPNAPNNWEGSLKKFENQKSIVDRYFLNRESAEYRESFITGFREAFRIAYDKTYKESNVEIAENNINFVKIAGTGGELKFKPSDGVGTLGGTLTIANATFYQETHIGVSMDRDSFNSKNLKYKPINHVYNIAIDNASKSIKLEKPMKLELDYYSTDTLSGRAGIYQFVNNEWRYIHTKQRKDGELVILEAEIPATTYRGGKYAIFVDETYKPIEDIKVNWASKELYTFLRRGYIKGFEEDGGTYYYPKSPMTRAHFVDLLGNVLGWDYSSMPDNTGKFSDRNHFAGYTNAINYASSKGYVNGHTDGTFRPWDNITYEQIEWILGSVMTSQNFTWKTYEQQMIEERLTFSDSIKSNKLPIKRAEIIFLLHELQKKNQI